MARPDAVLIHDSYKQGVEIGDRIDSILKIAEPALQVDRLGGEKAYVRSASHGGFVFVTRDPTDSFLYPLDHPQKKKPRYHWVEQPGSDGKIRLGTLLDNLPQAKAPTDTPDTPNQVVTSVDSAVAS